MGNLLRGEPKAGRIYILLYLRPFHSFCGYAGPDRDHGQKRRTWTVMENRRGKSKTGNDRNPWLYTSNNHRSEYKKFLNEKFRELGIGKYEKNMDNIFETLMNGGSPKLAIRYARRIIKNGEGKTPAEIAPGTKVHELVEELAKYLPEEMQRKFKEN